MIVATVLIVTSVVAVTGVPSAPSNLQLLLHSLNALC